MPHHHHGIRCDFIDDSLWCEPIEHVLAHIAATNDSDYRFIRDRIGKFCGLDFVFEQEIIEKVRSGVTDIYAPTAAFALVPGHRNGYVELTAIDIRVPADPQARRCCIAHELAHACDILRALDATGNVPRLTHRENEERADRLVRDWGVACPNRQEMRPGGWYDRADRDHST